MTALSLGLRSFFRPMVVGVALLCAQAHAQVSVAWQTESLFGPFGRTQTTDMALTPDGLAYVCGFVPSQSGDPAPGLTLMRIESTGAVAWSMLFPKGLTEPPFVARSPIDGGIIQVASFFNLAVHQYRTWAVKYDSSGGVSWSGEVPGINTTTDIRAATRYMAVDELGNAYIGGSSPTGTTSVPRIVSLDSGGAVRFSTPLTLSIGTFTNAATIDVLTIERISGDVFVAGHAGYNPAAGTSSFVARLTSNGAVTWLREKPAPAGLLVWIRDIGVDGQAYVSTLEQHSTSESYTNTVSLSLSRLDSQGSPAGAVPFLSSAIYPSALDVGKDGTVALSGTKTGPGYPGFIARYDSALSLVWEQIVPVLGATSVTLDLVTLQANGDTTASGLRFAQRFFGEERGALCVRLDAAGNQRWQFELSANDAHEFTPAHSVDGLGRVRLAIRQYPFFGGTPYQNRQITLQLDPEAHSFCHGDATSAACPCGISSGVLEQAGCLNSTGNAAKLVNSGSASLTNDTLVLTCSGVDANAIGLLVEGSNAMAPFAFGDGLLCVGGGILRLYIQAANGGVISLPGPGDPAIHERSAALGGAISAGQRRTYQTYYRDASLSFCPSGGTFNFSNALLVLWSP